MIKLTFIAAIFAFSASFTQGATALTSEDYFKKGMELAKNKQEEEAFLYIKAAAERGHADAMAAMGGCYSLGQFVEQSPQKAFEWWKKSAQAGSPVGMRCLAEAYREGLGVTKSIELAMYWHNKAAETGSANYQLWLANSYHFGSGGFKKSDKDAAKWFLKAAEQGHPEAMMRYAQYKLNGWGVPQSNQEALKWYKKVATYDYDVSRLADKDDAKSCAAEAQFMIGIIYAYKLNDYSQAEYWIQQSANNGYIEAKKFMKEISKHK